MPGLIVFRRRWSAGSDDLVVPSSILLTVHLIWLIALVCSLLLIDYSADVESVGLLWWFTLSYLGILSLTACIELTICIVSMRGSILDMGPRASMHYWLYAKVALMLLEVTALSLGIAWMVKFYSTCPTDSGKKLMFALVVSNWFVVLFVLVTIWCTFDAAGRSWVKMKKYQRSMRESESRLHYKRSGSMNRNWRQRKVIRAYQDSWDHRCRLLFCCMGSSERNRSSFADIAKLLSDFFRELDVVPSDVVAGLVLLRKFQKIQRQAIVKQRKNGTYEFLSGVPITERTRFLRLNDPREYDHFQTVIHYMNYALAAYGWPMFLMTHSHTGVCQLMSQCCCLTCACCRGQKDSPEIVDDNCCNCNYAAMKRMMAIGDVEVIYTTFHVDVGETPFFVAVDYTRSKIVVSIRGTLSMQDVLTDLNAEGDVLPLSPPRDDWLGHKGMVQAAVYINQKLRTENLVQRALHHNPARGTDTFDLVLVGHSLGAGTAAILAILMKPDYPALQCFSYSPPGGLLSMPAVEYSKSFITSVVVGKDVVPRIGLHQMETLRADLINAIQRSVDPKWKTIACTLICCCCGPEPTSVVDMETHESKVVVYEEQRTSARKTSAHPNDSSIALTLHNPLYPPGRIIHVVRHHPTADEQLLKPREPVYQAIWVDNVDFDEVLISPAMIQDHMPDAVLAALNKVITTFGPRKPQRQSSNANSSIASDIIDASVSSGPPTILTPGTAKKICLETSFTSLQSPSYDQQLPVTNASVTPTTMLGTNSSKASSVADSLFGRSQLNSILQYDVSSLADGQHSDTATIVNVGDGRASARCVAFTDEMPSPQLPPRGIMHRHGMNGVGATNGLPGQYPHHGRKSTSFALNGKRSYSDVSRKLDLVHDDWYGMAPLASPETLSEISSISSRASLVNNFATSIEKYLQRVSFYPTVSSAPDRSAIFDESDSDHEYNAPVEPTQMHTPVIMRRTPKIAGNLSGCADDWRSVDSYKRMGKVFVTSMRRTPSKSDSSELSYESASSLKFNSTAGGQKSVADNASRSADNLDEPDGGGGEILNASKLTWSDSAILSDSCSSRCPNCPCRGSSAGECCQQLDHAFCRRPPPGCGAPNAIPSKHRSFVTANSGSSDATFHSAQSSLSQIISHLSPRRLFRQDVAEGVLESHFPVYHSPDSIPSMLPSSTEKSALLADEPAPRSAHTPSPRSKPPRRKDFNVPSTCASTSRWTDEDDDDRCFSRNESLPLLSKKLAASLTARGLSSKRNRKVVYPVLSSYSRNASPVHRQTISSSSSSVASTKGGESSV